MRKELTITSLLLVAALSFAGINREVEHLDQRLNDRILTSGVTGLTVEVARKCQLVVEKFANGLDSLASPRVSPQSKNVVKERLLLLMTPDCQIHDADINDENQIWHPQEYLEKIMRSYLPEKYNDTGFFLLGLLQPVSRQGDLVVLNSLARWEMERVSGAVNSTQQMMTFHLKNGKISYIC